MRSSPRGVRGRSSTRWSHSTRFVPPTSGSKPESSSGRSCSGSRRSRLRDAVDAGDVDGIRLRRRPVVRPPRVQLLKRLRRAALQRKRERARAMAFVVDAGTLAKKQLRDGVEALRIGRAGELPRLVAVATTN